jgi:hypothetical protein
MGNSNKEVSFEELLISNMFEIEAVIELLVEKKILSREEIVEKIKQMRAKLEERTKDNTNIN